MGVRERWIVVGIDDSPAGRAAIAHALREAHVHAARVEAVLATDTPHRWTTTSAPPASYRTDRDLARLLESWAPATPVEVRVVRGDPVGVLLDAARGADQLVVGASRLGRRIGSVLGSVSLQCVLYASCPVTVVHPTRPDRWA